MILLFLVILWLVFGIMAAYSLLYRQYRDHQILGITLSGIHAQHSGIKKTVSSFTRTCYAVLLLSAGCCFLLLIPLIRNYAEFAMLLLIIMNLLANWLVIGYYQKKLRHIKEENNWTYSRDNTITVDLNVAREKGKSSISSVWVWLFLLLSFVPAAVLLFHSETQQIYPIGLSLIGPFCQLFSVFLYYRIRNQRSRILNGETEDNLLLTRQEERINSISATLSALVMLVFWFLFNLPMVHAQNGLLIIAPMIFLIVALLGIARWQQNKTRNLEETLLDGQPGEEKIQERQSTWKWGCYYDPNDPRVFVPKRIAGMGWTVNIGRPAGKLFYFGILLLVFFILGFVAYGGMKDYQIIVQEHEMRIDAAMYDMTVERDQVASLSVTDQLPNGTRTNGYGGANKSFGHFSLNGYGKCMLYVYNNVDQYIVVQLKEKDPGYVIINGKTIEETEALYQEISRWLSE